MARHRSPGGRSDPVLAAALPRAAPRPGPAHRLRTPSPALRGRVVVAAVATGAVVAAAHAADLPRAAAPTTADVVPLAAGLDAAPALGVGGAAPSPELLPVAPVAHPNGVRSLARVVERAARQAEARAARCALPAEGTYTSGFGARWGTTHWGIDIAAALGTPILAVADGVVVESGPASGFGMWVRVRHGDGTVTVYGHVDTSSVQAGQEVAAGEQIATMGDRGQSTGPHLHFEVWLPGGEKVDPVAWLAACGVGL